MHLLSLDLRPSHNRCLPIGYIIEAVIVDVKENLDVPHIRYLSVTIGDAIFVDLVLSVAQIRVDVVAGGKKDLQSLIVGHCLVTLDIKVVLPINAVKATFLRVLQHRIKKILRLGRY